MEHKLTVVVITAVVALLLVGTILAPIQSSAAGSRGGFPDTSSLKHAIRDGISVNQEHRGQHMNQENLCYRDNTCRQSDVGQNTLGNDNQVTGFADQSDNIQQAAAPTTNATSGNTNTPGGTPTIIINNFNNLTGGGGGSNGAPGSASTSTFCATGTNCAAAASASGASGGGPNGGGGGAAATCAVTGTPCPGAAAPGGAGGGRP